MRLFFDIQHQDSRCYDYHGGDFGRPEEATEMAELIAVDLGCSENEECAGAQVQVRNVAGETLFSVPALAAA
jgi:Domain of unknown function (DUF6894)